MKTHTVKKVKSFTIGLLSFIIATLIISLIHQHTQAQENIADQSIEVSPPTQEVTLDPGASGTITAKIRNVSRDEILPIEVIIQDFTASGEEGQIEIVNNPDSVMNWTKVTPSSFTLGPGETREVNVEIKVPTAAAGGRYGAINFFVVNNEKIPNQAAVGQQISSLFLLKISGPVTESVNLTSFTAPRFLEFGPVPFVLNFFNSGNVYTKTYGLINISNMFGQKVVDIVITPTNILPSARRNVHASFNKEFLIGPYTATAIIYFGTKNEIINATTTFFVFPIRVAAIIVLFLFFLFLLRKRIKKILKILFSK